MNFGWKRDVDWGHENHSVQMSKHNFFAPNVRLRQLWFNHRCFIFVRKHFSFVYTSRDRFLLQLKCKPVKVITSLKVKLIATSGWLHLHLFSFISNADDHLTDINILLIEYKVIKQHCYLLKCIDCFKMFSYYCTNYSTVYSYCLLRQVSLLYFLQVVISVEFFLRKWPFFSSRFHFSHGTNL